jgi:hypothetical protein
MRWPRLDYDYMPGCCFFITGAIGVDVAAADLGAAAAVDLGSAAAVDIAATDIGVGVAGIGSAAADLGTTGFTLADLTAAGTAGSALDLSTASLAGAADIAAGSGAGAATAESALSAAALAGDTTAGADLALAETLPAGATLSAGESLAASSPEFANLAAADPQLGGAIAGSADPTASLASAETGGGTVVGPGGAGVTNPATGAITNPGAVSDVAAGQVRSIAGADLTAPFPDTSGPQFGGPAAPGSGANAFADTSLLSPTPTPGAGTTVGPPPAAMDQGTFNALDAQGSGLTASPGDVVTGPGASTFTPGANDALAGAGATMMSPPPAAGAPVATAGAPAAGAAAGVPAATAAQAAAAGINLNAPVSWLGGLTGIQALSLGIPLAMIAGTALRGPGGTPPQTQAAEGIAAGTAGQGAALFNQGEQNLATAQANQINPAQQAQIDQYVQQQTNQLYQQYAARGINPNTDSGFQQALQQIHQQAIAMQAQFIQQLITTGLAETGQGTAAETSASSTLVAAGSQQIQLDTNFTNSLTSAMTAFGLIAALGSRPAAAATTAHA